MHTRVENLGTGTKGIPRTLIKGESTEVELSDGGWLMNLVKLNTYNLPSRPPAGDIFLTGVGIQVLSLTRIPT